VTVGAEAVHPYDRVGGSGAGFDGDGFEGFQLRLLQAMVSEIVVAVRFAAHIN